MRLLLVATALSVGFACVPLDGSDTGGSDTASDGDLTSCDAEQGRMAGFTDAHNAVRSAKGLDDLCWNDALVEVAQDWADTLVADDCGFYHSSHGYGENLFWNFGWEATPKEVTDSWASEEADYDYDNNSCAPGKMCGHYTQIVWHSTEKLGCAVEACADGSEVWVCNYDPPGNWVGEKPY